MYGRPRGVSRRRENARCIANFTVKGAADDWPAPKRIDIPDTQAARGATEPVRQAGTAHCSITRRALLFASLKGGHFGCPTSGAMYHEVAPTEHYRRADERFEVDGAPWLRPSCSTHGRSADGSHQVEM